MDTKDTREIKRKVDFYSIATMEDGKVSNMIGGYIYMPRTHFGGGTVKWFDDSKLVKGGAAV